MKRILNHTGKLSAVSLKVKWYLLLILILTAFTSHAQKRAAAEYKVKAAFLYNFTKFIDWPETAFKNSDDPFIIGIIGDDPFGAYLDETVEGEKIGTHPIKVKRFREIRNVSGCHMLYINSNDQEWVGNVLSYAAGKNILTVGDAASFNKWGGIIRFYNEENKIRLEINLNRYKEAQLNISSKLLSVAKTN